jgi:hypothetical protein
MLFTLLNTKLSPPPNPKFGAKTVPYFEDNDVLPVNMGKFKLIKKIPQKLKIKNLSYFSYQYLKFNGNNTEKIFDNKIKIFDA